METIPLQQLKAFFSDLQEETGWNLDGDMLWGYFFLSEDPDKLMAAGGKLADEGYSIVGVFDADEEEEGFVLHVERLETHTPETLHARNGELEAFASEYGLDSYDGMDVNPPSNEDEFPAGENLSGAIENPELLAAMAAAEKEDTTDNRIEVTLQLQQAIYLLPVAGEPAEDDEELELVLCSDDDDQDFVPLFTDVGALKRWATETTSAVAIDAYEAWEHVLAIPDCAGAVINPADESLVIPRDQVELLKNALENEESEEDEDGEDEEAK